MKVTLLRKASATAAAKRYTPEEFQARFQISMEEAMELAGVLNATMKPNPALSAVEVGASFDGSGAPMARIKMVYKAQTALIGDPALEEDIDDTARMGQAIFMMAGLMKPASVGGINLPKVFPAIKKLYNKNKPIADKVKKQVAEQLKAMRTRVS